VDVEVVDEPTPIDILCPRLLTLAQLIKVLRKGRCRVRAPGWVETTVSAIDMEMLGYAFLEKLGQDGGAFPVDQANDSPRPRLGAGRAFHDNVALSKVWMAYAKAPEFRPADEGGYHSKKVMQVRNVVRGRLLLVPIPFPPHAVER
jgi:hypothetical protein